MFQYFRTLWNPEIYHGPGFHRIFFEGWYFKLVDRSEQDKIVIIPGIYLNKNLKKYSAYIQVLDSANYNVVFHQFEIDQCNFSNSEFRISLGENIFSTDLIKLNLSTSKYNIQGSVQIQYPSPWPVKMLSPGAMGWYSFVPFMQCYHGVLSFDHLLSGNLKINGKNHSYEGGRGYIEKDWGRRFPSAYIWLQSNHFQDSGISIFASIARIPWFSGSFRGFIIGLYINKKLYRFTTYSKCVLKNVSIKKREIVIEAQNEEYELFIQASRETGGWLFGPAGNSFEKNVYETLDSHISVRLKRNSNSSEVIIFDGVGKPGALELNGDLSQIADHFE